MKPVLSLVLVLALGTGIGAQTMDCPCEQTVSAADAVCSSPITCTDTRDCASTTFIASCTGYYTFAISVLCEGGDCTDYNLCANVYEEGSLIDGGNCHNGNLDCDPCGVTCASVCLIGGHRYTLYACLTMCDQEDDCPSFGFCTGTATLTYCGTGTTACS